MNETTATNSSNAVCHAWIKDALPRDQNITLQFINDQLVKRNIGGISMLSVFAIIGFIGNAHVLYIYIRQFKTSNYRIYVIYLAIMDIIHCTVVAPLVIMYLFYPVTYPSEVLCKFFRFILYTMALASSSSLVAIAIDRNRKICNPFGPQFSIRKAKILCLISFLFSVVLATPAANLYGLSHVPTGIPGLTGVRCFTEDNIKKSKWQVIFNMTLMVYFVAVVLCLIIVYIKIGRNIFHHKRFQTSIRRMSCRSEEELKSATGSGAKKSTMTLSVVTAAYILSAFPHHLLALLIFIVKGFDCNMTLLESQFYYTFIWSYFFNSVVNPFIYGIRDRKFRFEVKHIYQR